jgi:uncharacterized membrane protein YdbT with pleckstrin-like domain
MTDRYFSSLLGQNEKVVYSTRQHWLVLVGEILSESIAAAALAVLITLIWRVWYPHPLMPLGYLLVLFPLVSLVVDVLAWRKRGFFVTNHRVIEIAGILNKEVTDTSLGKVNDVKLKQSFLGRIFDYGDVEILTASESGVSRLRRVRGPIGLKTAMLNARAGLAGEQPSRVGPAAEGEILGLLAHLDNLQQHGVLTQAEANEKKLQLLARLEMKV